MEMIQGMVYGVDYCRVNNLTPGTLFSFPLSPTILKVVSVLGNKILCIRMRQDELNERYKLFVKSKPFTLELGSSSECFCYIKNDTQ